MQSRQERSRTLSRYFSPSIHAFKAVMVLWSVLGLLSFCQGRAVVNAAPLTVGTKVSHFQFESLDGESRNTRALQDKIWVISVSDKDSSKRLQRWLSQANIELLKRRLGLKIAYLNIADVTIIPGLFQGFVRGLMEDASRESRQKMRARLRRASLSEGTLFRWAYLIPDWEGTLLARFGVEDGEQFYCWVVYQGRVIATFAEGGARLTERYVEVMEHLNTKIQQRGALSPPL